MKSIEEINLENRRRQQHSCCWTDPAAAAQRDCIPWDSSGMQLPYLPYSFTCTCALCGKVGILPDNKGTMPLLFLRELLRHAFAKTPFVFNVLYQMAFFLDLEKQQAQRWQDSHGGKRIPLHMRGRVTFCLPCSRFVRERAEQAPPAAAAEPQEEEEEDKEEVLDTMQALELSWERAHDEWYLRAHSAQLYSGEVGRRTLLSSSLSKAMIPMDLVFHMLHYPNPKRIPEYRMTIRLLKTLTAATAAGEECLYLFFPSIPLHTLVRQVASGMVQLKGAFDRGTISDRMHLSAFISGGKRRVSRADNGVACAMRTSRHLIERSSSAKRTAGVCVGFVPWREADSV